MTRALSVFLGLCLILGSCTQRMVCPAYQSAFIYDKDELRKKFSYFLGDSTPKVYTASKNKYLIAEPVSYRSKIRSMQTIEMKPVRVMVPDSLSGAKDSVIMADMDRATRSVIDSTYIVDIPQDTASAESGDSIYVITKDREHRVLKYNSSDSLDYDPATGRYVIQKPSYYVKEVRYQMEQDNYMWYLRDVLVLPDVRLAKMSQAKAEASAKKEKQGLKGFFKNLFKKKSKEEADSTLRAPVQQEEFDYIDESDTTMQAEVPQPGQEDKQPKVKKKKEKKPKAEKVSRKNNQKAPDAEPETAPAEKKEEDGDDGF